jgi:hypothetical protein
VLCRSGTYEVPPQSLLAHSHRPNPSCSSSFIRWKRFFYEQKSLMNMRFTEEAHHAPQRGIRTCAHIQRLDGKPCD